MVMMKHAACTSRDLIPAQFPHNHGAVSEYETLNLPYKPYSEFNPEDTLEEEVVPLFKAPSPWKRSSTPGIKSDPTLCITPEKTHISNSGNIVPSLTAPEKMKPLFPDVYYQDPALALTPETSIKTASRMVARKNERDRNCNAGSKSNLRTNKIKDHPDNVKLHVKPKVRFVTDSCDSDLEKNLQSLSVSKSTSLNKVYQPSLYSDCCDDNGPNSTHESRTIKYQVISDKCQTDVVPVKESDRKRTDGFHCVRDMSDEGKQCNNLDSRCVDVSGVVSVSEAEFDENVKPKRISYKTDHDRGKASVSTAPSRPEPAIPKSKPKRKVVVTREFEERPHIEEYQFPFSNGDIDSEYEHVFARPEYNSTLKLGAQIRVMKESHPDVISVLHKTLTESEEKRTEINEKAASKVNIPSAHLSGLVGVDIPVDEICQVEREITQKAKIVKQKVSSKPKPQKSEREPDLLEFFGPELQKELPDFSLLGLTKPSAHLATASHDSAFDLYRHNRVWEGFAKK